jgi:hypothetical protein
MKMSELYESEMTEDEVISLIKRDCKPFLSMKPKALLLRGMKNKPNHPLKLSVRTDRRPSDMPADTHAKFNKWFKELFGINARSECLFVTSSFNIARAYWFSHGTGGTYAVFPIGNFSFIWSRFVDDLLQVDDDITFDEFKELEYKMTDLNSAIDERNEIMIKCSEYYAVPIASAEAGFDLYDKVFG